MRRVAWATGLALLALSGASLRAQRISATTVLAVQHWTNAVIRHVPGEIDDSVMFVVKMTMDDRKALNVGIAKFLGALGGNGRSGSTAEKRIVDIGFDLARDPGMNAFLERAAVLHGDAAMFGYGGPVVLPPEPEKKTPSTATAEVTLDRNLTARNAPPRDVAKVPPLLFEGYDAIENDGELIGRTPADWNWVFARALLDLMEPKHVDDRFVGAWYHATAAFMFGKRLIGEASTHLQRAEALLPDDPRIILDRACLTEMQGLPRSQQILSSEDLLGLRLSGQSGQQSSGGLVRVGSGAQQTGRTMEAANTEAERLFRRVLDLDPRLFEARLRLARLLILRTRYTEALSILHAAPSGSAPSDSIGVFYVHLFTARAERALGHLDAAADHARQALALFPDAQSALMASSQIAMLRADAAGAEAPLRHLATLSADTSTRLDPWWGYDLFTGRDPRPVLREMWTLVATGLPAPAPVKVDTSPQPRADMAAPPGPSGPAAIERMLDAARRALAGDAGAPVRTFSVKGTKHITGTVDRSQPFEIYCELPDKFVWKEDGGLSGIVIRGFNRGELITDTPQDVAAAKSANSLARAGVQRDEEQLAVARFDFALWTLGLLAASYDGYPLQFIEAPAESGPNTVAVKSRDGALGLLMVFNASTHLPERLRYRLEATAGSIAIDKEILYQDYRDVGGRQVPFKLVMSPVVAPAAGPRTIQEYVVSDVKVNTAIDPKVFRR